MKLSLIASLICLTVVGCAATPAPIQQPQAGTVKQLPPADTKDEATEYLLIVDVAAVEVQGDINPQDYQRLSNLITREVRGIKCVCANGDPHCRCKLPTGPKNLPQE